MRKQPTLENVLILHSRICKNYTQNEDIFQVLKSQKKELFWDTKLKDVFSSDNYREKPNRLMPSNNQIELIKRIPRDMRSFSSQEAWFHLMNPHYELMFEAFDKRHRNRAMNDQKQRAADIFNRMKEKNQKHLITMDGHGRFILTFMRCLKENKEDINKWKFTVVDIDKEVDKWHKLFFPKSFTCKQGDMFSYLDKSRTKTKFVYMNFCSIPSGLKEKCFDILSKPKFKHSVIVSFSIRSRCKEDYTKQNKLTGSGLMKKLEANGASIICKRSFFVTLYI